MEMTNVFKSYESAFYRFMISRGMTRKASSDYISRLRFLSQTYLLDENLSFDDIVVIMNEEEKRRATRSKYSSSHAMTDFRSGLKKFCEFIHSHYQSDLIEKEKNEIVKLEEDLVLQNTERTSLVQSRIGQGTFRSSLIKYWGGCSVSGCTFLPALIASHIQPWCDCNNHQRLDVFNGLLLLPTLDKLFDKGYITFDSGGKLVISRFLDKSEREALGIREGVCLKQIDEAHVKYLKYHNEFCFMN